MSETDAQDVAGHHSIHGGARRNEEAEEGEVPLSASLLSSALVFSCPWTGSHTIGISGPQAFGLRQGYTT